MNAMDPNENQKSSKPFKNILFRVGVCIGILFIGVIGMSKLASLKKPPAESMVAERRLRVETLDVRAEKVPVQITGYGEVRVLNEVMIASEVAGKIVKVHPSLEVGEIIPAGETLFKIDDINYQASLKEADAAVAQWETTIQRLKTQATIDEKRLKTLKRNRDLSRGEFERIRSLFDVDKVGTRSGVERAEQAYNATVDQADQMAQAVTLYPMRTREAQSSLAAAKARQIFAQANLKRCRVKAPFEGRIKSVTIEKGQYVTPGKPLMTLADDSTLEIHVPLDSRDARRWLRFDHNNATGKSAWFAGLEDLPCTIHWTEDINEHFWKGQLNRVVNFDSKTRTLTVAIRLDGQSAQEGEAMGLPIVEGMFCEVRIPGKVLNDVFRLPRGAVSFDNTVFVSVDNRLKTVDVEVARKDADYAYVSAGLRPGDKVITTRLIDPIENALLEISPSTEEHNQKEKTS